MSQLQPWKGPRDNCSPLAVGTLPEHTCLWVWAGPGREDPGTSVTCCIRKRSHPRVGVDARFNKCRGKKIGVPAGHRRDTVTIKRIWLQLMKIL